MGFRHNAWPSQPVPFDRSQLKAQCHQHCSRSEIRFQAYRSHASFGADQPPQVRFLEVCARGPFAPDP